MSDKSRTVLTGAWERSGNYGVFFTGNVKKSELLAQLGKHGEDITVFVSPMNEKKKETSPDILISIEDNTYQKKA